MNSNGVFMPHAGMDIRNQMSQHQMIQQQMDMQVRTQAMLFSIQAFGESWVDEVELFQLAEKMTAYIKTGLVPEPMKDNG